MCYGLCVLKDAKGVSPDASIVPWLSQQPVAMGISNLGGDVPFIPQSFLPIAQSPPHLIRNDAEARHSFQWLRKP